MIIVIIIKEITIVWRNTVVINGRPIDPPRNVCLPNQLAKYYKSNYIIGAEYDIMFGIVNEEMSHKKRA